mgnify:FL=1|jgi:hypothetical protein
MTIISAHYDAESIEWRRVIDNSSAELRVDFEYSLLGYNIQAQRLDMLLRFPPGGHCRRHQHVASTVTLVLAGEQHLAEWQEDGTIKSIVRKKGEYAISGSDALIHDEWGGEKGGTVIYSLHAPNNILFRYFDEDMKNPRNLTINEFIESWENGSVYGAKS